MRNKKFVLDVNIWVSYFITKHYDLLAYIKYENKLEIFYCDELITEFERVLNYKHLKKYKINSKEAVNIIKAICVYRELQHPIKKYLTTDADDNYIIALALQTNSGFVTSGDRDILDEKERLQKKFTKLKIISKSEFENMFL